MKRIELLSFILCLLFAGGLAAEDKSGKKDSKSKDSKLKKLSKPVKQLFAGTWNVRLKVDEKKAVQYFKNFGLQEDQIPQAVERVKGLLSQSEITITINADGSSKSQSVNVGPNGKRMEHTSTEKWKVVEIEDRLATVELTETKKMRKRVIAVRFLSDDAFELIDDPDLKKVPIVKTPVFRRVKEEKK